MEVHPKYRFGHSISGLLDSQGAGVVCRGWLVGTVPLSHLATEVKSDRRNYFIISSSSRARICFKTLWAIAPAHAILKRKLPPNQIRQSTLSLAAGQDILHHRSAVDAGSAAWGVLHSLWHACHWWYLNNWRPCNRWGAVEGRVAHVSQLSPRPALQREAVAQVATSRWLALVALNR